MIFSVELSVRKISFGQYLQSGPAHEGKGMEGWKGMEGRKGRGG